MLIPPSTSVNFPLVRVPLPKNVLGKVARNLVYKNKDSMALCIMILLDVPNDLPRKENWHRLEPFRGKSRPKFGALWGTALRAPPRRRLSTGVDRITRPSRGVTALQFPPVAIAPTRGGSIGDLGEFGFVPKPMPPKLKTRFGSVSHKCSSDHCRVSF